MALLSPELSDDDGRPIGLSKSQWWLWGCWLSLIDSAKNLTHGCKVYVHLVGDIVDCDLMNRSIQIVTRNDATMIDMVGATIRPLAEIADRIFWHRGTTVHGGHSGQYEEQCAERVGAEKQNCRYSDWWWSVEASGVLIESAHKSAGDGRTWTAGGSVVRYAADTVISHAGRGERIPALTIRGHSHIYKDSGDLVEGCRCIVVPPFTLCNEYAQIVSRVKPIDTVGGIIIKCENGKYAQPIKKLYRLQQRPIWRDPTNT